MPFVLTLFVLISELKINLKEGDSCNRILQLALKPEKDKIF